MSQTQPTANELEKLAEFTPAQRDYIKALIREALLPIYTENRNIRAEIAAERKSPSEQRMSELRNDVNWLRQRYTDDDKYTLTRAKLVTFMKQLGIY
jgi:hypothetical protein